MPDTSKFKATIMIADDDEDQLEILEEYLAEENYQVLTGQTSEACLEVLESHGSPDLVLLDMCIPSRPSLEICQELKKAGHTKVIIMSGMPEDEVKANLLQAGGDDYLAKPFSMEEILLKVKVYTLLNLLTKSEKNLHHKFELRLKEIFISGNFSSFDATDYTSIALELEAALLG